MTSKALADIPLERACELSELRGVLKARKVKLVEIADAAEVDKGLVSRQLTGERALTLADVWEYAWATCLQLHSESAFKATAR